VAARCCSCVRLKLRTIRAEAPEARIAVGLTCGEPQHLAAASRIPTGRQHERPGRPVQRAFRSSTASRLASAAGRRTRKKKYQWSTLDELIEGRVRLIHQVQESHEREHQKLYQSRSHAGYANADERAARANIELFSSPASPLRLHPRLARLVHG